MLGLVMAVLIAFQLLPGWLDGADTNGESLALLPDLDGMPDGFVFDQEASIETDGVARPATPAP